MARRKRRPSDSPVRHDGLQGQVRRRRLRLGPGDYIDEKEVKRIDRFTQFALVAGIDAVRDSGLDFAKEDPFRCGVILGSGIGGLNEIEAQMERLLLKGPDRVSAFTIPKLMLNAAGGNLSIQYGLRGPNYTVATACASATNAIGDAFKTIQYDDADVMVTGGTEAAITPMGVSGFQNMRALSMRNDDPPRASRPFDRDRDGFVFSRRCGPAGAGRTRTRQGARRTDLRRSAWASAPAATAGTSPSPTNKGTARLGPWPCACATRGSTPPRWTTSMPTAPARRWATRRKPRAIKRVFGEHATS